MIQKKYLTVLPFPFFFELKVRNKQIKVSRNVNLKQFKIKHKA